MKVTELMIGDWVIYAGEEIVKIHSIFGDGYADFYYTFEGTEYGPDIRLIKAKIKDFEPIPLTAEILEKNGFKTNNDHTLTGSCIYRRLYGKWDEYEVVVRLLNGWLKVRSYDERWYDLLEVHFQPRYVHELQRALRCCGLWDLANNFKII